MVRGTRAYRTTYDNEMINCSLVPRPHPLARKKGLVTLGAMLGLQLCNHPCSNYVYYEHTRYIALYYHGLRIVFFSHKPTALRLGSVPHPESSSNTEQRKFFVNFVSPGYQWSDGPNLYMCRHSCQTKIQQGIVKAADQ